MSVQGSSKEMAANERQHAGEYLLIRIMEVLSPSDKSSREDSKDELPLRVLGVHTVFGRPPCVPSAVADRRRSVDCDICTSMTAPFYA